MATDTLELWICRLTGLPVSESWDRPPGPPGPWQIALTTLVAGSNSLFAAINAIELSQNKELGSFDTYRKLYFIVRPVACSFTILIMASGDRSALKRLSVRSECLREAMIEHGLGVGATNACRIASRSLLAMTLMVLCLSTARNAIENIVDFDASTLSNLILSILTIALAPSANILFWMIIYWSATKPLAELGIVEDVIRELTPSGSEPDRETDPEAEPEPMAAPEEDLGRPGAQPMTVHRCRLLIEVCDQANKLRLETNQWLHVPSCLVMFTVAWHYPLLIRKLIQSNGLPTYAFHFRVINMLVIIIGSIVKIAPIFCAQLVKHKREILVQKLGRKVDVTVDPALKRALKKLKIHAEEKFPDSLCVLMNFDFSFLPVLLNVVVLVITTFFQREDV